MANSFKRTDRVAEMIQRKLAQIIPQEVRDPRLKGFVTISAVKLLLILVMQKYILRF